ncbi:hypothetical protein HYH03_010219 [Edaphochlamys debaryana]|uniref:SAC3/GANP/THP3 conserved domain-containing protein n=1 Tax=Edaphochlamys debaryana TaxID=47281 RepID=A0A835XWD4_9CHLO|nr:hypothetical protein HYH03_010219 [Edaphochlamys debaryana]|eukprot:KAG2491433.1 hypothetical protein HYH03_010219 [Edaphochlamys debaryana]
MAYQAAAYPSAGAVGPQPSWSDPAYQQYYQQYYAANGYDYSAYYQQYGSAAAPGAPGPAHSTPAAPAVPPPAPPKVPPPAPPPGSPPRTANGGSGAAPPPPPPGDPPPPGADASKPPAAPPSAPAPPTASASAAPPAAGTSVAATASDPNADPSYQAYVQWYQQTYNCSPPEGMTAANDPSYAQAYAQWYAQYYAQYYGTPYPGYEQQQQYGSYYNQQQPQQAPYGGAPPRPQAPAGAYPYGDGTSHAHTPGRPGPHGHGHGGRQQQTGANTVPIGPRPPPGDPPSSAGRPQIVIKPQMPSLARAGARPVYIPVGSTTAPASTSGAASTSAAASGNSAVAAAVAEAAASAAKAAAASASAPSAAAGAKGGATQWPPSFSAWVTRCFNAARLAGIPDGDLSSKLMGYLDQVKGEGRLWTIDWDQHAIMLPNGASASKPGAGGAGGALSPAGPSGRKRTRWGEPSDGGAAPASAGHISSHYTGYGHGPSYERSQDVDSDEEDRGQYGGYGGRGSAHKHGKGAQQLQHLSNRKRKKLAAQMKAASMGSPHGGHYHRGMGVDHNAESQRRAARAGRFGSGAADGYGPRGGYGSESDMDTDEDEEAAARRFGGVVVGTSQNLEKSYFRLTSQPDPGSVRPEPVLEKALVRLVRMIAAGQASYFYSLDQFKGMRQDCTVQHLRNALVVRVYEAHARSSLEYGDLAEFNQCQARLGHLYAEGLPGCRAEFTAYRLLYETAHAATAGGEAGGGMARALLHTWRNVPKELADTPEIKHALKTREAVMTLNYAAFFRLYASAPALGRAILDAVAEPMRWAGLNAFVKACDLPVPVAAMAQLLGFWTQPPARPRAPATPPQQAQPQVQAEEQQSPRAADGVDGQEAAGAGKAEQGSKDEAKPEGSAMEEAEAKPEAGAEAKAEEKQEGAEAGPEAESAPLPGCAHVRLPGEAAPAETEEEGVEACVAWLHNHGAVVVEKGSELVLDTKACRGKLFVPEMPAKVAHGDENLSVNDFLSRAAKDFA